MRIPAAGLGVGMAFFLATATALSQTLPHAGADAIDQTMLDSSLLPATSLTLDTPGSLDQLGEEAENQLRPSDALKLQIYESGSVRSSLDNEREHESPGVTPFRLP